MEKLTHDALLLRRSVSQLSGVPCTFIHLRNLLHCHCRKAGAQAIHPVPIPSSPCQHSQSLSGDQYKKARSVLSMHVRGVLNPPNDRVNVVANTETCDFQDCATSTHASISCCCTGRFSSLLLAWIATNLCFSICRHSSRCRSLHWFFFHRPMSWLATCSLQLLHIEKLFHLYPYLPGRFADSCITADPSFFLCLLNQKRRSVKLVSHPLIHSNVCTVQLLT